MTHTAPDTDPVTPALPLWVVSDTHFGHANIVRYANRPADHEWRMIEAWAERVAPQDTILHLGDLCLCGRERMAEIAELLPGRKLLVKGNHDQRSVSWYAEMGFTVIAPPTLSVCGWSVHLTHVPDADLVRHPRHLNVHGHIHTETHPDRRLVNVSVEQTDYAPVDLEQLVRERIAEPGINSRQRDRGRDFERTKRTRGARR